MDKLIKAMKLAQIKLAAYFMAMSFGIVFIASVAVMDGIGMNLTVVLLFAAVFGSICAIIVIVRAVKKQKIKNRKKLLNSMLLLKIRWHLPQMTRHRL